MTFPGELLDRDGIYTVDCRLRNDGEYARPEPAVVVRVADQTPPPGTVIIDEQGRTLVAGEPFFPLAMMTLKQPLKKLAKFKAQGFNAVHMWPHDCAQGMELAAQLGLKVYMDFTYVVLKGEGTDEDGAGLAQVQCLAEEWRNLPALLGYHAPDERGEQCVYCLGKNH